MSEPLYELTDLTEEQLAADPRIGMRRLAFEFFLQQEYFGTAAMMVAEFTKGGKFARGGRNRFH